MALRQQQSRGSEPRVNCTLVGVKDKRRHSHERPLVEEVDVEIATTGVPVAPHNAMSNRVMHTALEDLVRVPILATRRLGSLVGRGGGVVRVQEP